MSRFLPYLLTLSVAVSAAAQTPTLRTILVDGDLSDWQAVLVNTVQVTRDGDGSRIDCANSTDRDCLVQSSGRDLRLFAWTYDNTFLYMLVQRQGSESNTQVFWHYMDTDVDGLMETGEPVLRVRFKGSNGDTLNDLYRYTSLAPGGDPMVDGGGFADGYTLPGTVGPAAIWTEASPNGGSSDGRTYEERVPWSVLGVAPGTPIFFHVSSSNSPNPGNVAAQIDDNLGRLGGGVGTLGFSILTVEPDGNDTVAGGGTARFAHTITNTGTQTQQFTFLVESSNSLSVQLFHDPDGNGVGNALIGTDVGGDGDFIDAGDFLDAAWDTNGDTLPETTPLLGGQAFSLVLEVDTVVGMNDVVESTELIAFLATNPVLVRDSAVDTTHVGLVAVRFDQDRGTVPGQLVRYPVEVCNNGAQDTYDLTAVSSAGHMVQLYSDPTCDGLPNVILATDGNGDGTWDSVAGGDTNGNRDPDTGSLATGQCACFVIQVTPGAGTAVGTVDTTVLTARGNANTATGAADLVTSVSTRIELRPDYVLADATAKYSGVNKPVFFAHEAVNNGSTVDQVDFTMVAPVNDQGWIVKIWSDPDGDGSIADGVEITRTGDIAPFGGSVSFIVEVEIPIDAQVGVTSTTTVTGTSLASGASDSVTDQVTPSFLSTYSDPLYAFATQYFAPCDTIYVQGSGLAPRRGPADDPYDLVYVDAAGNTVRFHAPFVPDPQGEAFDQHVIGAGDVAGQWALEMRLGGDTVSLHEVFIETAGVMEGPLTTQSLYPMTAADLGISVRLRNDNQEAVFRNTTLEYLVLDPTGTLYLDFVTSTFLPYTGSEVSFSEPVASMAPGEFEDFARNRTVNFPSEGAYTVTTSWVTVCGTVLSSGETTFIVGSGSEICDNLADDDGDGLVDCADPECARHPNCFEDVCNNNVDDDGDGDVDCADTDCIGDPACPETICDDGIDNDLDGDVDCVDSDCVNDPACIETQCTDSIDNDGDGDVDCNDSDCAGHPTCGPETICDNAIDDDQDTQIDCDDIDCVNDPACADDDLDDDGVPNAEDCAPLDPGAHHVPDETALFITVIKPIPYATYAQVTWTDLRLQAGMATVTDLITGLVSELWQDEGFVDRDGDGEQAECLVAERQLPPTFVDARRTPTRPDAFYYLVNAHNICGETGYGQDAFGNERILPPDLCFNR